MCGAPGAEKEELLFKRETGSLKQELYLEREVFDVCSQIELVKWKKH